MTTREMKIFAAEIRKTVLYGLDTVKSGHIGGCMSMADLLAVLYGEVMNVDPKNPQLKTRDRLVVSKGHCGPAVYAALALKGYFPMEWMKTINLSQTKLPSHCDMNMVPGIDMTTGSLGQGMSTALGLAWGLRYQKINSYVYLVLGDGECDEGQIWEGALFAGTKKIKYVIIVMLIIANVICSSSVEAAEISKVTNVRTREVTKTFKSIKNAQSCNN